MSSTHPLAMTPAGVVKMAEVRNGPNAWFDAKKSATPGGPPYDGGMEARLSVVEQAIVRIDATLPNLATKADIKDSVSSTERWMVATVIGLFIGFGGLFMAMSNALKPNAPQAQQAPIIINVPGPAPAK